MIMSKNVVNLKSLLMIIAIGVLLQGCSNKKANSSTAGETETIYLQNTNKHIIKFNKLCLDRFSYDFKCPEYLENCRVEIEVKDEFDDALYASNSLKLLSEYKDYPEYELYASWIGKDGCGVFHIPNVKVCKIDVYDSNNLKCIEIVYDNGIITHISVWKNGNLKCKANGQVLCCWEGFPISWFFNWGDFILYECGTDGKDYVCKEITTSESEDEDGYIQIITEYRSAGDLSHKKVIRMTEDHENSENATGYCTEVLEDLYL